MAVFTAAWDFVTDGGCWMVEQSMQVAVTAANTLDVSGITNWNVWWSSLPGDVLNVLALMGVGYALGIIASAAVIRLTLQLIPFVRLGS